jgi:hypothetical protein
MGINLFVIALKASYAANPPINAHFNFNKYNINETIFL